MVRGTREGRCSRRHAIECRFPADVDGHMSPRGCRGMMSKRQPPALWSARPRLSPATRRQQKMKPSGNGMKPEGWPPETASCRPMRDLSVRDLRVGNGRPATNGRTQSGGCPIRPSDTSWSGRGGVILRGIQRSWPTIADIAQRRLGRAGGRRLVWSSLVSADGQEDDPSNPPQEKCAKRR